jgi:hypothetical protein
MESSADNGDATRNPADQSSRAVTNMAIEFSCPHCNHAYRLKDEFAGRKATCKNPDCRQQITIPIPPSAAELEAAAHSALADEAPKEEAAGESSLKTIPMTCSFCGHQWTEPMAKAGKNTLCPECRQRLRVPEPKEDVPDDWRQQKTKLPSGAKERYEKLEGVQDAAEARIVSGEALREADATGIEYEPRSAKQKAFIVFGVLGIVAFIGFGIWYLVSSRRDNLHHQLMEEAQQDFAQVAQQDAPSEAGLCNALLRTSAAEYTVRQNSEEALKAGRDHYTKALSELQQHRQSPARFHVAGEIASVVIGFGGSDEEVNARQRFAWQPGSQGGKFGMGQKTFTVLEELRKPLEQAAQADIDYKLLLARRLTRELTRKGQEAFAADMLPLALFADPEKDEARAVVALEIHRLNKNSEIPRKIAEALKARIETEERAKPRTIHWNPYPASAQILCDAVGVEFRPLSLPQGNAGLSDNVRFAYTGIFALRGDLERALEVATRGTSADAPQKIRSLALCAEWSDPPVRALDAAVVVVNGRGKQSLSQSYTARLAEIGMAHGHFQQARELAGSLTDEGLRAWAIGSGLRERAGTNPKDRADEGQIEAPRTPDKVKAGHYWGRLWIARQNARLSGDREAEKAAVNGWSPEVLRRAGLAGIALGLQDRD